MRLALQIFRKDTERLWWAILPSLALVVAFAIRDTLRPALHFPYQDVRGGWLNLVLPFVWSLLIALVIRQDSLVGDRQFWVTLPCGARSLALAKAIFILAYIQVPYFVATAAILIVWGFNPIQHLPHLFWKQLVLLALLVPAVAVATVVKNVTQFVLLLITLASAVVLLSTRLNLGRLSNDSWDVRWQLTVLVLCVGGLAVAILQFSRRCTIPSRVIGVATVIAAAALYGWLPREASAAIDVAFSSVKHTGSTVSVGITSREMNYSQRQRWYNFRRTTVMIPLAFTGLPSAEPGSGLMGRFDQIGLELIAADGEKFESEWQTSPDSDRKNRVEARVENGWQAVLFDAPAAWNRLGGGHVTIHGRILARYYRFGTRTALEPGDRSDIAGVGRCADISSVNSQADLRKVSTVECESPEIPPEDVFVWFNDAGVPRPAGTMHGDRFYGPSYYPQDPWLSPLHRGVSSAGGVSRPLPWEVARQTLSDALIIDYSLPDLDLNRYVVQPPVSPEPSR